MKRPRGITVTTALMCACNALGWFTVDWTKPHAAAVFVVFTVLILIGYVFLWFYWKGRNWARIAVLLTSILTIYNLRFWQHGNTANRFMTGRKHHSVFSFSTGSIQPTYVTISR